MSSLEVGVINYNNEDGVIPKTIDKNLINNATNEQRTNLHSRREANFDMFKMMDDGSLFLGPFVGGYTVPLRPGRYYLKVTASAENMRREDTLYILDFDGCGSIKYRMLNS
ncbi:MAG TPA: hypothetical protein VFO09_01335 [Methyloceanibacter sp.]|nr:hypothetical protein [Methyloceanibacter sp.]